VPGTAEREFQAHTPCDHPPLLYVCGGGHSGSTLLDLLLGEHPGITSVGEISVLNRYLEADEYPCSCGRVPNRCPFWQEVMESLATGKAPSGPPDTLVNAGTDEDARASITAARSRAMPLDMRREHAVTLSLKRQYLTSGAYLTLTGDDGKDERRLRRLAPNIMQRMDDTHRLFDAIRRINGTPVVLDSSKHAYRLRLLRASRPESVFCVFLVRDGRARTFSDMRRDGLDAESAARRWVKVNMRTRRMIAPIPPSHRIDVTYEQLCREPRETLERICASVGLPASPELLGMQFEDVHNIGGNRARFGKLDAVREDTQWRKMMSPADLAIFEDIAGPLNRELLGEHYRY